MEEIDGCTCQQCGVSYKMDLLIPDELWERITGITSGGGLLCPSCIVVEIEKARGFSAFKLTQI
jgi:hypothetical protein